jgi:hypothetical protein
VDYYGKRITKGYVSRRIKAFNLRHGGYKTTVTDIRRIIETDTTYAALDGRITEVAARAMMVGQGHSYQTALRHYVKIGRTQSSRINTGTFDVVTNSIAGNESADAANSSPAVAAVSELQEPSWWSQLPPVELATTASLRSSADESDRDGVSDSGESMENSVEDDGAVDARRDEDTGPPGRPVIHGFSDWGLKHPQGHLEMKRYIWSDGELH